MEYRTAIVDECGDIIAWVSDIGHMRAMELLDEHPEWHIKCIEY